MLIGDTEPLVVDFFLIKNTDLSHHDVTKVFDNWLLQRVPESYLVYTVCLRTGGDIIPCFTISVFDLKNKRFRTFGGIVYGLGTQDQTFARDYPKIVSRFG